MKVVQNTFLEKEISEERMIELIRQNSRRYAKRQLTWFRKQEITWLPAENTPLEELVKMVRDTCG